ncbi:hypothetical protein [Acinetobacter junii]
MVNIDAQGNITFTPNAGFTGQEKLQLQHQRWPRRQRNCD